MKKFIRVCFIILLMLPLIAVAHFFAFPQETRCILIRFADFEKKGNFYFRENTDREALTNLEELQVIARRKVMAFWNEEKVFNYTIIYCNNEEDFNSYGYRGAPAATQLKLGAYVVLKKESLDKDIIAHEIGHTVLYNKLGWYNTKFKVPTWFDEGLAMQVDNRDYYSLDSLEAQRKAGLQLPDVTKLNGTTFYSGNNEEVMLNFLAAKHVVHQWLKTHSLNKFIISINQGKSFALAYAGE